MTPLEKKSIDLHKQYLYLHDKITIYERAGINPPDYLWQKFKDIERKMRIFSRALEKF
jgi:hypothetical protein